MTKEIFLSGMTADQLSEMIRESLRDELRQAPSRTLRRDAELSDPPRDGPPPAHLARDAQRLGEPRPDPRPQDRRARALPQQRCRSGTAPDCPHQKPIAMKTPSDCIGIREYLLRRGLQPHRETVTHGMFLSPLREERTPSFSVRYDKGLWYDFGLGEGGTLLQAVMRLEGCGKAEAIRRLRKGSANKVPFQPLPTTSPRKDSPLRILGVGEIRHPALIGYLRERGIDPAVAGALCREVHYAIGERRFFAIGFRNDAGGWELCATHSSRGAAPRNPSRPSTGTATRRCSSRASSTCSPT